MTSLPAALVLTAGLGTRLWPLTARRAKPAVPLAGPSLIERILSDLARQGVSDAVLNLHHLPATITRVVGDGDALGVRVRYSLEPRVLGSAGGPRHALPLLGTDPFLLVNGDTLTDVDLARLVEAHRRSGALVTMVLVPNPAPDKYGGVQVDAGGTIAAFTRRGTVAESWHFVGVQVVAHDVFAGIEDGTAVDSVGAVYPQLMRERPGSVRAFTCDGRFLDVGTPADYLAAARTLAATPADLVSRNARVAPDAVVTDTIVWPGAVVGAGTRLTRCIVADLTEVPSGLVAEDRVLLPAAGVSPRPGDVIDRHLLSCAV